MNPEKPAAASGNTLTAEAARERILAALNPVAGREWQPLRLALGRVLAEDVAAPHNVPAHDNSAMDGYAIQAAANPAAAELRLRVVGRALAGQPFSGAVGAGQAVRIMTGALLPAGANAVVEQEKARLDNSAAETFVVIPAAVPPGSHIRRAGEDLRLGQVALHCGKRIGAAELGLLASLGIVEVPVKRPVKVAIFSTGDELAPLGKPLAPGEVHDSNRYTLHGLLTQLGAAVVDLGIVPDQPDALERTLNEAAHEADAIITTGGVSVGEADYVREVLARAGSVDFWKLQIKPGRPMAFGRVGGAQFFGLPGNPVAVMVCFIQFVEPALLKMSGQIPVAERPCFQLPVLNEIKKQPGRREYLRARLVSEGGVLSAAVLEHQGSGVLSSMSAADCLVILPEASTGAHRGDTVAVQLL